jgi:hypothetical protein
VRSTRRGFFFLFLGVALGRVSVDFYAEETEARYNQKLGNFYFYGTLYQNYKSVYLFHPPVLQPQTAHATHPGKSVRVVELALVQLHVPRRPDVRV